MTTAMIHCTLKDRNEDVIIYQDNIITHIGFEKDLKEEIDACDEVIDLKGLYVSPGFVDSHMHLLELGFYLSNVLPWMMSFLPAENSFLQSKKGNGCLAEATMKTDLQMVLFRIKRHWIRSAPMFRSL